MDAGGSPVALQEADLGLSWSAAVRTIQLCTTLGGAAGPLVAGHLFDVLGSYRLTFQMVIAMALVAWGLLLSLRPVAEKG